MIYEKEYENHRIARKAMSILQRRSLPREIRGYATHLSQDGKNLIIRPYVFYDGKRKFFKGGDIFVSQTDVAGGDRVPREELIEWMDNLRGKHQR